MSGRATPRRGGPVIGRTHAESTPWFPERPHPGPSAPNVVVVLLDDTGFAQFGCYGAAIDTPNIDALAAGGLRYTNFHVTSLCSPTRAALLTGRNHHEAGMRAISNFNTGFPNMRGHVSDDATTIAEVLRDEGWTTFCVGKWHLCQMEDASSAGPFEQWPLQRGFDRFYGFLEGETDQFAPDLTYDNHRVEPPPRPDGKYHLSEDLVDHAIGFIHDTKSVRPDRPFFLYLAFGATHAPHQAPEEYLVKYRGRFDQGWDSAREECFARQLALGIVPAGTQLAPRNPGVEPWDTLSVEQRLLAARLQEAFAAFLEHADVQIGRLVEDLRALGELDNTILVVLSDNGASQEGGPFGVLHEMKFFNGIVETPDKAVAHLDDIGGPRSHSNYPWGWAQAGNTPFKWYKQNTHEGGVHVPLILHWPTRVRDGGSFRHQFHHVNDVAPTIYELVGVETPTSYRGRGQMPITGTSMAYTLSHPEEPTRKTMQYFEMLGHRGIWADGWKAVTRHNKGEPYDEDQWELYRLEDDASECRDLASELPDKLAELIAVWWAEADAHGVLPLDDRLVELFGVTPRDHSAHPLSRRYTYWPPVSPLPMQAGPPLGGRAWEMSAEIDRPNGSEGVLLATGTRNAGLSWFIQSGLLVLDYNCFGEHTVLSSTREVPIGRSTVGLRFARAGSTGTMDLLIGGEESGSVELPLAMRIMSSVGPSIGFDHGSPVSDCYDGEFRFSGTIHRLEVKLTGTRSPDPATRRSEQAAGMARQ
jgi:arylsulfatase